MNHAKQHLSPFEGCPVCGGTTGYKVVLRARGPWICLCEWNGDTFDTDLDKLKYREPKTARCLDCNARFPNPTHKKRS